LLQQLQETTYWLELLEEMHLFLADRLDLIRKETKELTAIFVVIVKKLGPDVRISSARLYPFSFILYPLTWSQAPHKV